MISEAQILNLAASVYGPREDDLFAAAQATTAADREAIRALVQAMAHDGKIRRADGRIYHVRQP